MKFVVLNVATAHEKWCELATETYTTKINHFVKFEVTSLPPKKLGRDSSAKKVAEESMQILDFLKADDFVVLFDETGKTQNSIEFAKTTERILNSGKKRGVWILGGAFGVSDEVKKKANVKLNLAPFVLNHLVAQTVALEQIYRSFTILKGLPYHNS